MPARILIIEDNAANLELVRYLIESAGHIALIATNGSEGIAAALSERPDLILCDLQMPLLDGYGVLERVRADPVCSDTPIIAVTAFSMRGDEDRVLTAGFNGYCSKPIAPETFVAQIETFLPDELLRKHRSTKLAEDPPDHG